MLATYMQKCGSFLVPKVYVDLRDCSIFSNITYFPFTLFLTFVWRCVTKCVVNAYSQSNGRMTVINKFQSYWKKVSWSLSVALQITMNIFPNKMTTKREYLNGTTVIPYLTRDLLKERYFLFLICYHFSLLVTDFFFQILAHPVFKMWVIREPNKVALWNKRHFEEKKMEIIEHV